MREIIDLDNDGCFDIKNNSVLFRFKEEHERTGFYYLCNKIKFDENYKITKQDFDAARDFYSTLTIHDVANSFEYASIISHKIDLNEFEKIYDLAVIIIEERNKHVSLSQQICKKLYFR